MCQQSGQQPTTTASGVGAWCYWLLQSIPISIENELPAHRCARVWSCVGAGGVATNGRPWGDVSRRGTTWECVAYRCPLAITIGILGAAAGAALSILRCMRDRAPSISLPVGVASQRKHMQRWPADRATQLRHADMSSSPRRRRLRLACHLMPCHPTTTRGLARRGSVSHTAQWLTYRPARRLSEVGSVQTAAAQRVLLCAGASLPCWAYRRLLHRALGRRPVWQFGEGKGASMHGTNCSISSRNKAVSRHGHAAAPLPAIRPLCATHACNAERALNMARLEAQYVLPRTVCRCTVAALGSTACARTQHRSGSTAAAAAWLALCDFSCCSILP